MFEVKPILINQLFSFENPVVFVNTEFVDC